MSRRPPSFKPLACDGKVPHPHAQAGRDAIHALARVGKKRGRMDVYRCQHCGSFHIGHKPAKPRSTHGPDPAA